MDTALHLTRVRNTRHDPLGETALFILTKSYLNFNQLEVYQP